jgi:hypothetical protein
MLNIKVYIAGKVEHHNCAHYEETTVAKKHHTVHKMINSREKGNPCSSEA